jgi:hypothetical protein
MPTTKNTRTVGTAINPNADAPIPNSRLIKGKAPQGVKMSDLLKPLWDANVQPRATNEQIRKEAWQRHNAR